MLIAIDHLDFVILCNAAIIQWAKISHLRIPLNGKQPSLSSLLNSVSYLIPCAGHLLFVPPDPLSILFLPAFWPGWTTWTGFLLSDFHFASASGEPQKHCWKGREWGGGIYYLDFLPHYDPWPTVTSLRKASSKCLFLGSRNSSPTLFIWA